MTTKLSDLRMEVKGDPSMACLKGGGHSRPAEVSDLVEALKGEGAFVWYCEAWEQHRGVSEPCESGSTHDAPEFNCHWRFVPLGEDA